jgi:phosphatidylglycerol:prolipoprotein diacylglycerol transferase
MHPEVFHWGVLHIRSYGLMLAIAFLVGTAIAAREARRLSLDEDQVVTVVLIVLIASVLGARALYVLEHIEEFRRSWGSVVAVWQGGLTFYGGLIAGTVAGLLSARRMKLPMWTVADALTPSLALGTAFGRVGCWLNGCCYGHPTQLPWGVTFPADSFAGLEFGNAKIHPSQLYFAFAGVLLFAILWALRRRVTTHGVLFWIFMLLYSIVRVPLDATRAYEAQAVLLRLGDFAITESQIESFAIGMFSLLMILRLRREAAGQT